ncbi:PH domain-containing protein [Candidatus Gracilibacteria bacterium]|jgi:hypothetical protein|nr:PH domain-containing protein [Candidatus Gracilibacteria bacterium]
MNTQINKDRFFKGQQEGEEFVCFFRHHWIELLKDMIYFSIFFGLGVLAIMDIEKIKLVIRESMELKLLFLTFFIIGNFYIHKFFIKLINYFTNIGIITDRRVIDHKKTVFLKDTVDAIYMAQIQNIEKIEEGLMPSIFGFGDIKIFLSASDSVKIFCNVPNAKFHFRCISRQKEIRQMAMLKERLSGRIDQEETGMPEIKMIDSEEYIEDS